MGLAPQATPVQTYTPGESGGGIDWTSVINTFLGVTGDVIETKITGEQAPAPASYYDQTTTPPPPTLPEPSDDISIGGLTISPLMLVAGLTAVGLGLFFILK